MNDAAVCHDLERSDGSLSDRSKRIRWGAVAAAAVLAVGLGACSSGGSTAAKATAKKSTGNSTTTNAKTPDSANSASVLTGDTPCEKAGPPASEGQVLDGTGHFHRGPTTQVPLTEAQHMQLQAQQIQARAVVAKYSTVAQAVAAGYRESTVYVPCIGAHYTNVALAGAFNPAAPSELLYDGTRPNSHIIGLSYLVWHPGGAPAGFAGTNDHWHQHTFNGGLCMGAGGMVIGAESDSPAACAKKGGRKIALTDIWMLHDWAAPGFDCSWGVFASECPELGGKIGLDAWHT
jgi:hypothetical protein